MPAKRKYTPRRDPDEVKIALASLTFDALKHALRELPGSAINTEHEMLEDCVCEVKQISDLQALVSVAGHGKKSWYLIKVQADTRP